jgi:hypothetical protein
MAQEGAISSVSRSMRPSGLTLPVWWEFFSGSMSLDCRKLVKSSYTAVCSVDAIIILFAGTRFVNKL